MANRQVLTADKIWDILDQHGISYFVVQKLDKTLIGAFSTISNGHPTITATYRYNDIDKLAFDILHELCHIDKHLSDSLRSFIAVEGVYSNDPREKEANEFARNMLIPNDIWNQILKIGCKNLSPHIVVRTIARESERYGISPSIAVARYKHDKNWYNTTAYKSRKIM